MKNLLLNLMIVVLFVGFPLVGKAVDESLVLYFSFEEGKGDIAEDKSGHGNTGTLDNNPEWVQGKQGKGLKLGGGSFVNVSDNETLDGMSELTIEFWVNITAPPGSVTTAAKADWNASFHSHFSSDSGLWWGYNPDDRLKAPANTVVENEWVHLALWFSGDEHLWKVFKNGEEVASGPATIKEIPDTGDDFSIGGRRKGGKTITGTIDEVAVYNRALSAEEIERDMEGITLAAVSSSEKLTTTWASVKNDNS